jgi:GntR family transcriptional regulator
MVHRIDHQGALPLHAQVEHIMRDLISRPEYQNGKLLPGEVDLAKRFGISRNTVRQALNQLVHDGLLIRKKGIGTRVAGRKTVTTRLDNWLSFTQEMNEKGITFQNLEIAVSWDEAPQEVDHFFTLPRNKSVLKLERLRGLAEGPVVYFISWFHPRIGLKGDEDFSKPLYHTLEESYHTVASLSREEISAMAADKIIAQKLRIRPGDPILFRKRFVFDPGRRPVEFNIGYYNAQRFTYSIEIERSRK